jgi:hypothetical protein
MNAKQWIGIAIIAIVVPRLWNFPAEPAGQHPAGDSPGIWMQFLAYSIIHAVVRAFRAFHRQQVADAHGPCRSATRSQIRRKPT